MLLGSINSLNEVIYEETLQEIGMPIVHFLIQNGECEVEFAEDSNSWAVCENDSGEVMVDRLAGVVDNIKAADKAMQEVVLKALIQNPVSSLFLLNLLESKHCLEINNSLVKRVIQQVTFMEKDDFKIYVSAKTITQHSN